MFGADRVKDRARIDLRRHLKGDPGRKVCLDEPGEDVDGGSLRGQQEVDADGSCHLSEARDRLFHIFRRDHHQVRQLVDHHDDVGKSLHQRDGLSLALLRHLLCPFGAFPPLLQLLLRSLVVMLDVSDPFFSQDRIPPVHLINTPLQCEGGLLGIGHHRVEQVGDIAVIGELQHLRVDHDEPDLIRSRFVEDAADHRVDGIAFSRSGRSGHQEVRHPRKVDDTGGSRNIFSQSEGEL